MVLRRLDRRLFLQASALLSGAAAGMLPQSTSAATTLKGGRVIVIGAGIAGLGAAWALAQQGAEVTIFEAKDRIGGRIHTDYSLGPPFEAGAAWIHGPSTDNPVRQLADAVGAKYFATDHENIAVVDRNGRWLDDEELEEVAEAWAHVIEHLDETLDLSDRRSLRQAIDDEFPGTLNIPAMQWAFNAQTEFQNGGPLAQTSSTYHDDDEAFPSADVVITTGYDAILAPLTKGLNIHLSTPVNSVTVGKNGVAVETAEDEFIADVCICAVPLGVLKFGGLAFRPALPQSHLQAMNRIGLGSVTKIAMKFDRPFWDIETQYFGVMTETMGRWGLWLNYRTFTQENILVGLSLGDYALVADGMSDREMIADALDVLRRAWGERVGRPSRVLTTRWSRDRHVRGAYSFPMPGGGPGDYERLSQPVGERLFFCGEHTIFEYKGTVHGAFLSGLRTAEQIMEMAE